VQWLSGTIAQPAIAPQQAPTLDVNLGPLVQTHRTTGLILKKGSDTFTSTTTDYHKRTSHITTTLIPPPWHPAPITSRQTVKGPAMSPPCSPALESGRRTMPRALVPAARSGARKNGRERRASAEVLIALRPRSTAISLRLEHAEVRPSLGRRSWRSFSRYDLHYLTSHIMCSGATSGGPHSQG